MHHYLRGRLHEPERDGARVVPVSVKVKWLATLHTANTA